MIGAAERSIAMLHFCYAQIKDRVEILILPETALPPSFGQIAMASWRYQVEWHLGGMMYSTESPPLNDDYAERDVDASDLDAERASPNRVHGLRPDKPYRSSGFKSPQIRRDGPTLSRRLTRSVTRFFLAIFIGVAGTLAWQCADEVTEFVRTWVPSLGWLLPVSTTKAAVPPVTSAELQQQLKPMAIDLALVRRSIEQLAANQDQLARKQDQMARAIAALQTAEQDISQKMSVPPSPAPVPKAANVPPPKPLRPAAQ